jgi:hypothetical protein
VAATATSTPMASATVSAEAGMSDTVAKAAMVAVTEAAMEPMAMVEMVVVEMVEATKVKIERAIIRITVCVIWSAIIRLHRASGEDKTGSDQEGYRLRHHSAAIHRSLHSCEVRQIPSLVSPSAIYVIAPPDQCNSIGRAIEMLIRGLGCQCNLCTPTCLSDIVPSDRRASRHTRRKKRRVSLFDA